MSDAEDHVRGFLEALGASPGADTELEHTPARFAELMGELFGGLHEEPPSVSVFETPADTIDPVVIAGLEFKSMCVHHLVPFFGTIDVAYIPGDHIIGFGSVGRLVEYYARRPQLQERMVEQIADHLERELAPKGLLVRCGARQMCMELRGAKKRGWLTTTTSRGVLREGGLRQEVLHRFEQARG
ncbi:MAG: GTP cyclohydrolase I [Myxococcota bacterium]